MRNFYKVCDWIGRLFSTIFWSLDDVYFVLNQKSDCIWKRYNLPNVFFLYIFKTHRDFCLLEKLSILYLKKSLWLIGNIIQIDLCTNLLSIS